MKSSPRQFGELVYRPPVNVGAKGEEENTRIRSKLSGDNYRVNEMTWRERIVIFFFLLLEGGGGLLFC